MSSPSLSPDQIATLVPMLPVYFHHGHHYYVATYVIGHTTFTQWYMWIDDAWKWQAVPEPDDDIVMDD